jgi:hypothetical protein
VLTPLTAFASAGIETENTGSASALLNVMRNLCGAIGIAVLRTFLTKREQFRANVPTCLRRHLLPARRRTNSFETAPGVMQAMKALAWTEAVTLVSQTHVPDAVFAEAKT